MKKSFILLAFMALASTILAQSKPISLEDIWQNGTFRPEGISNIRSMNDGEHYTVLSRSGIDCYSYSSGQKESTIVDFSSLSGIPAVEGYEFSDNERLILLESEFEPIYRHSGLSTYHVYDRDKASLRCITDGGKQRLTTFSPDGTKVAYVRDNNLYWMDLASLDEHPITTDGKLNEIIYGTTDWVYEEEFAITKGFAWSPDSKRIAYYRFDESQVREYTMQMWGDLYPENYKYKYPKAGEDNSKVEIRIYNLETKKTLYPMLGGDKVNAVAAEGSEWEYLPRFQWTTNPEVLAVMRMNRLQSHMQILTLNTASANMNDNGMKVIYDETDRAYVEVPDTWQFLNDGKSFIITSERDGFRHIYLYGLDGKLLRQLTSGSFEVKAVCGIDEKSQTVYFTSHESSPVNTDLYKIDFKAKKKVCLNHSGLGTYSAMFSKGCKYYITVYSNANAAPVYSLYNAKGKLVKTLVDNARLQQQMADYGTLRKQFDSFSTSTGTDLNYYVIKPADFSESKKYPVLFYVYGGPGNQQVTNSYGYSDYYWYHMLADKGYVVVCFDGRGTGGRGAEFKKQTYRDLGHMECEDAIEAARWFGKQPWVDADRIGIWGWSFGGYLSSLAILKGNDVFKAAIAVAPVITWRYYDNIYTERFLALPEGNAKGYDDNSPLNFAERLSGNYLLIHGTGDDNVHVQNSLDMLSALERAGKQFEFRLYPNKNHSIYGGNTRLNLYQLMTDFILRKL
ncbi:MAG: S9 family peptidase [Bacteroidales bacterium]|nr:S9 family peptidase [Bacteroidales bacterium]